MNSNAYFREYSARAASGSAVLPRCGQCSTVFMPPRAACPECGASDPGWMPANGAAGTLYSFTVMGEGPQARIIALAELDAITDGSKFYAQLLCDDTSRLTMGAAVTVGTADLGSGELVPVLTLRGAGND